MGISGPVVATSATGAQLAIGPPGPQGIQGPTGATGAAGPAGAAANPWVRVNFPGGGVWLPSGSALGNFQDVLIDCSSGQAYALFPPAPVDNQPCSAKDPSGSWVSAGTAGQMKGNAGQKVELPSTPGTLSAIAASVTCWPQAGAKITWTYDAVQNAWLLG